MKQSKGISWNIVNRTGEEFDSVTSKLRPRIVILEKFLNQYPVESTHLQIILDSDPSGKTFDVVLNLRIPSDVLHVRKESMSLVAALDDGLRTLVRHLKQLKRRYMRDYSWKNNGRLPEPGNTCGFNEKPMPDKKGPQTENDSVIEVLKEDYGRMLGFVSRQIHEHVMSGVIPGGVLDPHDIVDRVAEEVLRHPGRKPSSMNYHTWCSSLAFQQTRKAIRRYAEEAKIMVPIDLELPPEPAPAGEDDMEPEEFALNLLQSRLEPEESSLADVIPDPKTQSPVEKAAKKDFMAFIWGVARRWPKAEREIFHLHFLEGLSVDDIAHTLACERSAVEAKVSCLRAKLRTLLSQITELQNLVEPSPGEKENYARHLSSLAGAGNTVGKG